MQSFMLVETHDDKPEKKRILDDLKAIEDRIEEFQSVLSTDSVSDLWTYFRECENKKDGRVPRDEFEFGVKRVLIKQQGLNWSKDDEKKVLQMLFERFNYYKKSIDIYDFLISLSVLSRISNCEKTDLLLTLMDVDEDKCLSIGEVFRMILAIEKNFVKELNYLNFQSGVLYNEMAFLNALRKFRFLTYKKYPLDKMNRKYINQTLITYDEFKNLLNREVIPNGKGGLRPIHFLPHNERLIDFLKTRFTEIRLDTTEENKRELWEYMVDLHNDLRPDSEHSFYPSKVPGRITVGEDAAQCSDSEEDSSNVVNYRKKGTLSKSKKPKKKAPSQQKPDELLLFSLNRLKKHRETMNDDKAREEFYQKKKKRYLTHNNDKSDDSMDREEETDPDNLLKYLNKKLGEHNVKMGDMRSKAMQVQKPNAFPNSIKLNDEFKI